MCRGPRRVEDKNKCGAVATPKGGGGGGGGCIDGTVGATPPGRSGAYS